MASSEAFSATLTLKTALQAEGSRALLQDVLPRTSPEVTLMQTAASKQKFPTPVQASDISLPAGMQGEQGEVVILPSRHAVHSYLARGDKGLPLMQACLSKLLSMVISNMPLTLDVPLSQLTLTEASNKIASRNKPSARR